MGIGLDSGGQIFLKQLTQFKKASDKKPLVVEQLTSPN